MKNGDVKKKPGEQSFTIFETIVALGIMLTVMLEVLGAQGNITAFSTYSRKVTEATWLAKRIMSQVEYHWHSKEIKELETNMQDQTFEIGREERGDFDYTYSLSIEEWELPLFDILMGGGPKTEEDEQFSTQGRAPTMADSMPGVEQVINSLFDGHILKMAHVEVFWPEGARRNSIKLSLNLTNQRDLDKYILTKTQVYNRLVREVEQELSGREPGGGGEPGGPDPENPPDPGGMPPSPGNDPGMGGDDDF